MEIIEIDVLDGKGKISVVVGDYTESIRLKKFVREMHKYLENIEKTDSPIAIER